MHVYFGIYFDWQVTDFEIGTLTSYSKMLENVQDLSTLRVSDSRSFPSLRAAICYFPTRVVPFPHAGRLFFACNKGNRRRLRTGYMEAVFAGHLISFPESMFPSFPVPPGKVNAGSGHEIAGYPQHRTYLWLETPVMIANLNLVPCDTGKAFRSRRVGVDWKEGGKNQFLDYRKHPR